VPVIYNFYAIASYTSCKPPIIEQCQRYAYARWLRWQHCDLSVISLSGRYCYHFL